MRRITINKMVEWGIPEELAKLHFGRRKYLTARQIADCVMVPSEIIRIICHEELIPAKQLHDLECRFIECQIRRERKAGRDVAPHIAEAIETKRRWINGQITDKALSAFQKALSDCYPQDRMWVAVHCALNTYPTVWTVAMYLDTKLSILIRMAVNASERGEKE